MVFAVRSALKHSVLLGLLGPKFRTNFFRKKLIFVRGRYARGGGGGGGRVCGSGNNAHFMLYVEKSICESYLSILKHCKDI